MRWRGIVDIHLIPAFRGLLRSINVAEVESYMAKRAAAGAAAWTIRQELNVLIHMLHRAVKWEFLGRSPLLDPHGRPLITMPKAPPGRIRFLSREEIDRLLAACTHLPYLRAFVLVALNTGCRRNEILTLTRTSVDWQARIATLSRTKNGEARRVYLNDVAFEALRSLPVPLDGRLFPQDPHAVRAAFLRAVRRAKIENFRLHDLRHTFCSYQAMSGVAPRGLQELMGHKDPRMTACYSHLSDAYLRAAVDNVQLGGMQSASTTEIANA